MKNFKSNVGFLFITIPKHLIFPTWFTSVTHKGSVLHWEHGHVPVTNVLTPLLFFYQEPELGCFHLVFGGLCRREKMQMLYVNDMEMAEEKAAGSECTTTVKCIHQAPKCPKSCCFYSFFLYFYGKTAHIHV